MKTHYPELFVVKEIVTDTLVETLVDVLVKDITGEQKLLVLSIEGIEYTSYREASDKLNLKTSTIKRRVNSKKFEAYLSLE
jgi:DNA-directed RNA polymerase specialized sigma24 family protein